MAIQGGGGRFSALLLEGLDHYRKGRMLDAVKAWEEAYLLEPTNLRAREFLRSALERIHAVMSPANAAADAAPPHPWLPPQPPPAAPRSPWDEGPSLAIPQPETGDSGGGAWSIHADTLPNASVSDDETDVWMRGARELVALNDFSGALELLNKLLQRKANDKDALQLYEVCEHNLTLMYESKIGSMDARPRTAIPPDEIIWLNLDPRAGFVLAQIDGEVSFDDLYAICGLKRLDTARILCELLEQGVVQVQGRDQAVAKRAMPRN